MNTTYSGSRLEKCSNDELKTQISHLAHDLDKTINTLPGLPEFESTAEREIRNLMDCLGEWDRRSFGADETTDWANELISKAKSLVLDQNYQKEANIDSNIEHNKAEELFDLIQTRRSVRSWQSKNVPKSVIDKLLEAATWAPSACNRQSVRYIVLEDDEQRMALVKLREKFLGRAPVLIFIGADSRNYYPEEVEIVPYLDAAVATQNLLLMAHAMGLGAVMVKCTNVDIKMDATWSGGPERRKAVTEMYSKLNLPDYFLPVAIVALGYPKRIPKAPPRLRKDDVRFFERFIGSSEYSNLKSGESTIKYRSKLLIIKIIHRIVKYLGIRIYITLDE
jgi:nitroreductase